ncbi:hypothetical protein L1987_34357 [Smallanthus sonchifolius]|uniref:Uncharacterized protein n=1 Tax=Smallanthus sonchifolius TaxID=185202 RepID=A0ACB9HU02_9ASTR|nr:hypothetical protein L1987_34357 [Smallanthus sonchifolius]
MKTADTSDSLRFRTTTLGTATIRRNSGNASPAKNSPCMSRSRSFSRDIGHVASETYLITRLAFTLLRYLGLGRRWMLGLLALLLYAMLLLPGFLRVVYQFCVSSQVRRSIVYGDQPRNRLDLFLPKNIDSPKPVVIFVTGGAWIIGYKAWGALLGLQLAERDIIVASIDYRNFPQGTISNMVEDVSQGISFVCKNISEYGGDPNRIYLMGQSAGAHISSCALFLQAIKEFKGDSISWSISQIKAYFGLSGVYNLPNLVEHFNRRGLHRSIFLSMMEGEESLKHFSPEMIIEDPIARHAVSILPRIILFHGTEDSTIPPHASVTFVETLKRAGVPTELILYKGKTHTDLFVQDPLRGGKDELFDYIVSYIHAGDDNALAKVAMAPTRKRLCPEPLLKLAGMHPNSTARLSNPLITDEGKIYICLEKNLLVFQSNGSISKRIPLNYTCNVGITPVLGASRKVYLVAENRVLKINTMNTQPPESAGEVLLGPETGIKGINEIIGLTVSISFSCVIININRRGLFGYRFDGRLKWSTGPAISRRGYRQGCRRNITDCYFVSVPIIDHCDANIYVSNNQGELYSVSLRTPQFKWIQDFSSLDKNFTITAGNNGQLYVTVPTRSIILALDVLTGTVLWQNSIGPLSAQDSSPVANVNGWISIGSFDGFLYSISPSGFVNKFPKRKSLDTVIQARPVLDCSGYAVYMSQTKMEGKMSRTNGENTYVSAMRPLKTVFTLLVPATGSVYWSESYPGDLVSSHLFLESDLRLFVMDESVLLAFLSISNTGNPLSCFSTRQKLASSCSMMDLRKVSIYTGNEKAIKLFLFYETILLIIVAALVRFCCVFWRKKKLQNQDLGNFLEKRNSLRLQKKICDRTITELEKKTEEGTSTNEMLEKLGDLVKEREGIERKLSTTYSLGRDATSPQSESLIPLSDKKTKSVSFKSGQKESVTVFHTISDPSSEDDGSNEEKTESKGKALMEPESSSDDGGDHEAIVEAQGVKILDEGVDLQSGSRSMRKRSISLTRSVGSGQ